MEQVAIAQRDRETELERHRAEEEGYTHGERGYAGDRFCSKQKEETETLLCQDRGDVSSR